MKQRENRASILFPLLLWILLVISGCHKPPVEEVCAHQWGALQTAVPAGFFETGSVAHYQCAGCGALLDEARHPVDTVTVPKLSTALSVCINGQPASLTLAESSSAQITWTLEHLAVTRGDLITVCDDTGRQHPYTAAADGIVDGSGSVLNSTAEASVTLVATPQDLSLSLCNHEHPGIVAQINGEQAPMHITPDAGTYLYGYIPLQPGDRLTVTDNVQDITYGYDALSEALRWNTYDFHRGDKGELIIDCDARYLLEFSKDGDLSVTKVLAPTDDGVYQLHFSDGRSKPVTMTDISVASDSPLFGEYCLHATEETTLHSEDITGRITAGGLHVHSAVVYLEAGTQFHIEGGSTSTVIAGDRLTHIAGGWDFFRPEGQWIEITQSGTYHIRYLPTHGSLRLEQLSTDTVKEAANQFDKQIAALPSKLELYYAEEILALYRQYLTLPDSVKSLLKIPGKLETMYKNVLKLDSGTGVLYYLNTETTNHVYRSRGELMEAFFTDFYYYITVYHGTAKLRDNGVKGVSDFVKLAKVFPDADETDFYQIGYAAGKYFLESRRNDVLHAQSEEGFMGFCYQNGLYQEILPFLIRYFAYWRIDEGYATLSNCGADLFAEGWAPTVDIAKFFYYDDNTSPVKSARMIDCFTNTAGVVYGLDPAQDLPTVALRGYIFEGWYDNPQFSGNPVTVLEPAGTQLRLYAKWRPDTQQQDRDAAALVDIYIYNLTTRQASTTAVKVGYVKEMYEALSDDAKHFVSELPTLEDYIDRFS